MAVPAPITAFKRLAGCAHLHDTDRSRTSRLRATFQVGPYCPKMHAARSSGRRTGRIGRRYLPLSSKGLATLALTSPA
jgi:hypothetical protein